MRPQGFDGPEEIVHLRVVVGVLALVADQVEPALHHQPLGVEVPAAATRLLHTEPLLHQGGDEQFAGAHAGLAGAEEEEALVAQGAAGDAQGRQDAGDGHRGGALDVVVEAADLVAVLLQQVEGVAVGKVLELDEGAGVHLLYGEHELLEQVVVHLAAQPRVAQTGVERVVEQTGVVRAQVQSHRQAEVRVDAGTGGVQGELAHRDAHAVGAQVAQTEDAFAVGDDDDADVGERPVAEQFRHPAAVVGGDVDAARPPEDVAELHAGLTHGGGVDDGHQFVDILEQHPVEQGLVAVLEGDQGDVAVQVGGVLAQVLEHPLHLLLHGVHPRRQQAAQAERLALRLGEGRALVQGRVAEQGHAGGETGQAVAGAEHGRRAGGGALLEHGLQVDVVEEPGQGFPVHQVLFETDVHFVVFMGNSVHTFSLPAVWPHLPRDAPSSPEIRRATAPADGKTVL